MPSMSVRPDCYPPYSGRPQTPHPMTPAYELLDLLPPPGNNAPPFPPRPELPPPPEGWRRTYHAVPAAYPRGLRESHGKLGRFDHPYATSQPGPKETKEERKARLLADVENCVRQRFDAKEWDLAEAQKAAPSGLFLAAERWTRDKPRGGYTILCSHANGMQKEHWAVVLREMLSYTTGPGVVFGTERPLKNNAEVAIDDIWFFDDVNHAQSLDLNEGHLGPCEFWEDNGRDQLNFILHILPGIKATGNAPYQPDWAPEGTYPTIPVIGFGQSLGGAGHVFAALHRPDAYIGLFLGDPMVPPRLITRERFEREGMAPLFRARDSLKRRDTWESREAARKAFSKIPMYQQFDPRTFEVTISHGLVPVDPSKPDGPVMLATPPWSEVSVFVEPTSPSRAWDKLSTLKVKTGFLMARDPERTMGPELTQELVWRPPLARNERLIDADHLLVQQNPSATAQSAWRFLQTLSAGEWGSSSAEIRASYEDKDQPKARL